MLYGAFLAADPANRVIFIDRNQERSARFNTHGINITENGTTKNFRVESILNTAPSPGFDYLFVLVKSHHTREALADAKKFFSGNTVAVSLQNGMFNDRDLAEILPSQQIILGISNHNSTILAPCTILHPSPGAQTFIGPVKGGNVSEAEKACRLFSASGTNISATADIHTAIWKKLLVNMVINPLTMLKEKHNGFIIEDKDTWAQAGAIIREGIAAAGCCGITLDTAETFEHIYNVCTHTRKGRSSMWQDRIARRKTEIDRINGAVAAILEENNIPAPANRSLTEQVHLLEKEWQ